MLAAADGAPSDYETQGMALKLKELDDDLKKYETRTYPCEAHLTWCEPILLHQLSMVGAHRCDGGSHDLDDEPERANQYPYVVRRYGVNRGRRFTIAEAARRQGISHFDASGACKKVATHRVVILEYSPEPES